MFILEDLIRNFLQKTELEALVQEVLAGEDRQLLSGLSGSAKSVFLYAFQQTAQKPMLIVSPNLFQAQKLYEDLTALVGEDLVHLYPAEELVAAEFSVSSFELRAQRIETIDHMVRARKGIYITPIAGLRRLLPTKEKWLENHMKIDVNDELHITEVLEKLVSMHYTRNELVTRPGEFALRGGILDVYPPHLEHPIRIELFDTDVDSIRTFSADDQRSIDKLQSIDILPAAEYVWGSDDLKAIAENLEGHLADSLQRLKQDETKELLTMNMTHDIQLLKEGNIPEGILKYASFAKEAPMSLGTYFAEDGIVFFDEISRIQEVLASLEKDEEEWFLSLLEEGQIVHGAKLSFTFEEIIQM